MLDTRVGPYHLHEHLGDGGMGTVYRATVEGREEPVALKLIHPHLQREPGFRSRFEREAEVGRKVAHENVVRTLGAEVVPSKDGEAAVLVMEYVEGRTLRALLGELGSVPESLLRELARQIAAGLGAIHDAGIIHRDLKPENVLITRDDRVRIMDLGLARPLRPDQRLTREGHFSGSLLYAAPEQLRGEEPDTTYDQYALGLILYELASGQYPFRGQSPAEIVGAHLHASPRRLIDTQPDASPFLSEVVATLMDKAQNRRFPSTSVLRDTLERGERSAWWADRARRAHHDPALRRLRIPVARDSDVFGRTQELGILRGAWEGTQRGGGRTVLVEGEAGVGKTRLLDAFVHEVERHGARTLYGSYPPEGTQHGLTRAILDHLGGEDLVERLRTVFHGADALADAFALALRSETLAEGAWPLRGDALSAALVRLAQGLARERPTIWIVEDLHNAGPAARRRVLAMARALEHHPLLLVLTTRPGAVDAELPELSRLETFHHLDVPRLEAAALQRIIDALFFDREVAERLGPLLIRRADGVPFFVFELVRGLTESGRLRRRGDGRYEEVARVDTIEAPPTVRDLVRLRLADLSDDERHLVDVAAVQGFAFDPELQAAVLQMTRVKVLQTLAWIERRGGLVRSRRTQYQFDHHLVQEVVRSELPLPLRQEYHALLAQALAAHEEVDLASGQGATDPVAHQLAVHLLGSTDPHACLPFVRPAIRHLSVHAGEEPSRAFLRRVLDDLDRIPPAERVDLLLRYAGGLHAVGRQEEEQDVLDEAEALADRIGEEPLRTRVVMAQGMAWMHLARPEKAVETLRTAIVRADAGGFDEVGALARQHLGFVYSKTGRHEEALQQYAAGRLAAQRTGERSRESGLLGQQAAALWALGREEEAEAAAAEALALAREAGDWAVETRVLGQMGSICARAGRLQEAATAFRRLLEIVEGRGLRAHTGFACGNLGRVHHASGHLEKAQARFEQTIRICREEGDRRTESMYHGLLGSVQRTLGDAEGAKAALDRSLRILRDVGDRPLEACGLNVLGMAALARGAPAEAVSLLRTAIALFDRHPFPPGRLTAVRWLGMAQVRTGEIDEGRRLLEEARETARALRTPQEEIPAAAALAALGHADAGEVLADLRARASALEHRTRMRAVWDLHRATGDPALLREARELLDHLVRHAPARWRARMRETVPLHREITAGRR